MRYSKSFKFMMESLIQLAHFNWGDRGWDKPFGEKILIRSGLPRRKNNCKFYKKKNYVTL